MRLVVEHLDVSLSGRPVLHGINMALSPGEVVGLLGPNGAGKSTLMRALAGQIAAGGRMRLDGGDLAGLAPAARARLLAYLPQARVIGWRLTVRDLVALGRLPWRSFGVRPTVEDERIVADALKLMDIAHLAQRPATELSGGEQARVLAARAVAQSTSLLIADEPASGLDPAHQMMMMHALRRLAAEGRTILVSLHDLTLAARWCDRVVMLKEGRTAAEGAPEEVMTPERLAEVYGVTAHFARDEGGMILAPTGLTGAP
ncbi:ABC transporter ATP-binding protein [Chelativorans sp. AA-79]|uniref:ABC transporter ATP-binding protein n=1 Tax=Chelativorans sp. AA-79 TaxID=3028735 RepID=UPI0023F779C7|nr:ABC transporter ATP-binding protein [Chelativorans sp. AA-79]WEX11285.1 ABC transporter ATP-binding protein [Chelativorans sp. AA-79]